MSFKKFLIPMGFVIPFLCSTQAQAIDPFNVSGTAKKDNCFKGYADEYKNTKKFDEFVLRTCLCLLTHTILDLDDPKCNTNNPRSDLPETSESASKKAAEVYYDDCYCPQEDKEKGKLPPEICDQLGKIARDFQPDGQARSTCGEAVVMDVSAVQEKRKINDSTNSSHDAVSNAVANIFESAEACHNSNNCFDNKRNDDGNVLSSMEPPSENDDKNKEPVSPFPTDSGSPVNPISFSQPGNSFPGSRRNGSSGLSSSGGGRVSGSRARVPGARVGEPGSINSGAEAQGTLPPLGLMDFPTRGTPGGDTKEGSGPSGSPPRGGSPGMGGAGRALGGGGPSPSRRRPRRRRGGSLPESGNLYMSAPRGGSKRGGGGYPRSSINRQVKKKMEENKRKKLDPNQINALFQKELKKRGSSGPQSFTPVFYFPDIQKAYEELGDQNQFLDSKGTDL